MKEYFIKNYHILQINKKLEKKYASALDNYGQSCFVRSDLKKMKCVCKTQMMPPPDHQIPVDMHTSIIRLPETCWEVVSNSDWQTWRSCQTEKYFAGPKKKSPQKFTVMCILFSLAFLRVFYPSISNWASDFTSGFHRG